jgi:hypothetical protein
MAGVTPKFAWGSVKPSSIGKISSDRGAGSGYCVDFPEQRGWHGADGELELVAGGTRSILQAVAASADACWEVDSINATSDPSRFVKLGDSTTLRPTCATAYWTAPPSQVTCFGCGTRPILGACYECQSAECKSRYLCWSCYEKRHRGGGATAVAAAGTAFDSHGVVSAHHRRRALTSARTRAHAEVRAHPNARTPHTARALWWHTARALWRAHSARIQTA